MKCIVISLPRAEVRRQAITQQFQSLKMRFELLESCRLAPHRATRADARRSRGTETRRAEITVRRHDCLLPQSPKSDSECGPRERRARRYFRRRLDARTSNQDCFFPLLNLHITKLNHLMSCSYIETELPARM